MATAQRTRKPRRVELRVGSKVSFVLGGRRVHGTIVEDRGNIGYQGRRIVTVRLKRMWTEDVLVEIPAEKLRAA
jgi:hypothetical protein